MKRDSYSDQKSHASFQPRSLQSANEPTQLNQPNHHSSAPASTGSAPSWLNKASSWVSDKVQAAQNLMNKSEDAIASDQILPGLKGTANQPLVGVIDTGFAPHEHGSKMVEAIQKKNPQATIWKGGGVGTGGGLESLAEFVDVAKATGHSHAVANLSFDLTEVHPDGSISTRTQLTAKEQSALAYARDNGVMVVASSGNQGGVISALGQASQPFDNLIVVGAANEGDRAPYSSYGKGLDLVAEVGAAGTSSAAANVTGTIAKLWSTNPELSNQQINQILTTTATDLKSPGWDAETGAGLLNSTGAIDLASQTIPQTAPKSVPQTVVFSGAKLTQKGSAFGTTPGFKSRSWTSLDGAIASDRPNWGWGDIGHSVLDVAGFIPVVGAVADVANSAWYATEGDYANAAISLASAVPGVGDAFAAGAKAVKATKAVVEGVQVAKAIPSVAKVSETASHIAVKAPPITIPKVVPVKSNPISVTKTTTKEVPTTSSSKIAPPTKAPTIQSVSTTPKVAPVKSNPINVTRTTTKEVPTTSSSKIAPSTTGKSEATPSVGTPRTTARSSGGNFQKTVAATTVAATVAATVAPIVSKGDSKPNPSGSNPAPIAPSDPKLTPPPNTLNSKPESTTPIKSSQPDVQKHTIQPGDTLWTIAQDQLGNGDRWHELRKPDGSSFTEQEAGHLQVGTPVQLPNTQLPNTQPPSSTPDEKTIATSDPQYTIDELWLAGHPQHTIRPGETLWEIAERTYGDGRKWTNIRKSDKTPYTSDEARQLQPGTIVYLSGNETKKTTSSQEIGSPISSTNHPSEYELSNAKQSAQKARARLVGVSDSNKTETHAVTETGQITIRGRGAQGDSRDRQLADAAEAFMYKNNIEFIAGRPKDSHAERKVFIDELQKNPDKAIIAIGVDRPICDAGGTSGGECTHFFEEAAQVTGKTIVIAEMDPKNPNAKNTWVFRPDAPPEKQSEN